MPSFFFVEKKAAVIRWQNLTKLFLFLEATNFSTPLSSPIKTSIRIHLPVAQPLHQIGPDNHRSPR